MRNKYIPKEIGHVYSCSSFWRAIIVHATEDVVIERVTFFRGSHRGCRWDITYIKKVGEEYIIQPAGERPDTVWEKTYPTLADVLKII